MSIQTDHPHVVRDPGILHGQPVVTGSGISVAAIARFLNSGLGAPEIADSYDHLSLAAIHDAISYYLDHRNEIDRIIEDSTPAAMSRRGFVTSPNGRVTLPEP